MVRNTPPPRAGAPDLLADVQQHAALLDVSVSNYFRRHLRRGSLYARLQAGAGVTPATETLIRRQMAEERAARLQRVEVGSFEGEG